MSEIPGPARYGLPYQEASPPLNPSQERVVLGYGDRAPEPQNPEEWSLHAGESMAAIAEVCLGPVVARARRQAQSYAPQEIHTPEAVGLYFYAGSDSYEVRIQPRLKLPELPEDAALEQIMEAIGPAAIERRQKEAPEYKWTSLQAHRIKVQQYGTERELHTFDAQAEMDDLEQRARFLRRTAIYVAASEGNRKVLAKLLPQEAHE